ncbi:glycosyltransferase [Exiguobacterium alkaliphilum]|uniref:glycosyltransferase n=1 Tax=Exiguobacterium alkaliphilum TaxID=1428684 RepID=UPI0005533B79|nr:glycosyltransferase [Exiguobacterium alkaliphilum]
MRKVLMCEYMDPDTKFQVGSHYFAEGFLKEKYHVTWCNKPSILPKNETSKENFIELTPRVFAPFCKLPILNSDFWAKKHLTFLSNTPKLLNEQYDVLWMTNVKMAKSTEIIKYHKLVHRVADNFKGFSGSYQSLINLQNELIDKSDLTIVTARKMLDDFKKNNNKMIYLPNGVNVERFLDNNSSIPELYKRINGFKVVYVGAIENWIDMNLIISVAKKMKNVNFIFIGNHNYKFENEVLKEGVKNIIFLGLVDHDKIPSFLKFADVGIMPFKKNELTDYIHPLKIYEYLAAGIPVISRNLVEVREMNAPIYLYNNEADFINILNNIMHSKVNKQELIDYSLQNTWEKRFRVVNEIIEGL